MSKREHLLDCWVKAVRSMEPEKALQYAAPDFVFWNGAFLEPITREGFPAYLLSWESRTKAIGGTGKYEVIDELIQDHDSTLLKWGWWQFTGTDVQGASLVRVTDLGITFEKIAYYRAPPGSP